MKIPAIIFPVVVVIFLFLFGCENSNSDDASFLVRETGINVFEGQNKGIGWHDDDSLIFITDINNKGFVRKDNWAVVLHSLTDNTTKPLFLNPYNLCVLSGNAVVHVMLDNGERQVYDVSQGWDFPKLIESPYSYDFRDCKSSIPLPDLGRDWWPLPNDWGYLQMGPSLGWHKALNESIRYVTNRQRQALQAWDDAAGRPIHLKRGDISPHIVYSSSKGQLLIHASRSDRLNNDYLRDEEGLCYEPAYWMNRKGLIAHERLYIPCEAPNSWVFGYPMANEYFLIAGAGRDKKGVVRNALYLSKDKESKVLYVGSIWGIAVAPNGCRAAFSAERDLSNGNIKRTLKYIDICEGKG